MISQSTIIKTLQNSHPDTLFEVLGSIDTVRGGEFLVKYSGKAEPAENKPDQTPAPVESKYDARTRRYFNAKCSKFGLKETDLGRKAKIHRLAGVWEIVGIVPRCSVYGIEIKRVDNDLSSVRRVKREQIVIFV